MNRIQSMDKITIIKMNFIKFRIGVKHSIIVCISKYPMKNCVFERMLMIMLCICGNCELHQKFNDFHYNIKYFIKLKFYTYFVMRCVRTIYITTFLCTINFVVRTHMNFKLSHTEIVILAL